MRPPKSKRTALVALLASALTLFVGLEAVAQERTTPSSDAPSMSAPSDGAPASAMPETVAIAPPPAPGVPVSTTPAAPAGLVGTAYVLGSGDRLKITVFGEPDLSGEFLVDSLGNIGLPLLGQVGAQGQTLGEFKTYIEQRLREAQILNDPDVSVEVTNFRPFYILGEVARPGTYPYTSGLDVFSAVATAGGFTPLANQTRVLIKRSGERTESSYSIEGAVVGVRPGDTVRIVKGSIYVLGEVNNPGEYPFSTGMTVHNAVAAAGGYTYRANRRKVMVRHEQETREQNLRVTPGLPVQPGDTLRIPECILCY